MRLLQPRHAILVAILLGGGIVYVRYRTADTAADTSDSVVRPVDSSGVCRRNDDCDTDPECELLGDVYSNDPDDCLSDAGLVDPECMSRLPGTLKSASQFCRKAVGDCGGPGRCVARGDPRCDDSAGPVCGCDGKTYKCAAEAAYRSGASPGEGRAQRRPRDDRASAPDQHLRLPAKEWRDDGAEAVASAIAPWQNPRPCASPSARTTPGSHSRSGGEIVLKGWVTRSSTSAASPPSAATTPTTAARRRRRSAVASASAASSSVVRGTARRWSPTACRACARRWCWNQEIARLGREHNDANGLALGARVIDLDLALEIVRTWLDTSFEGGRHLPRIRKSTSRGAGHELLLPMRRTRRGHHLRTSRATLRRAAWM